MSKIDKNKLIEMFKKELEDDELSVITNLDLVDDYVAKNVGRKTFEDDFKDAILAFGDWYIKEIDSKYHTLKIFTDEDIIMPYSLIIYNDWVSDEKKLFPNYCRYDKYLKIYNKGLRKNYESIIAKLTELNLFLIQKMDDVWLSTDEAAFSLFVQWWWFKYKDNDELLNLITANWKDSLPLVLEFNTFDEEVLNDSFDEYLNHLDNIYKSLPFSDKRNVDTLYKYITNLKNDTLVLFVLDDTEEEPKELFFPGNVNPEDKSTLEMVATNKKILKAYITMMVNNNSMIFVNELVNEEQIVASGFISMEGCFNSLVSDDLRAFLSIKPLKPGLSTAFKEIELNFI